MSVDTKQDFPTSAFVLAAGLGMRMRPLTENKPKPLVEVVGKPLIDYSLEFLERAGIETIVINSSYKADMLEAYLAERAPDAAISYETAPLETGGGIAKALPLLGDVPFVTINSDIICLEDSDHPVHRMRQLWDDSTMDALLLLQPTDKTIGFKGVGDFFLNEDGSVKRRGDEEAAPYVYCGIQLLHPRLLSQLPEEEAFSLNVLYDRGRLPDGTLPRIKGIVHDGSWLHVGDIKGLEEAEAYFATKSKAYA